MRKLKLNLETLFVESFETRDLAGERGTIEGRSDTEAISCLGTCAPYTKCGCQPITITEMPTDINCDSDGCTGGIYCTFECPTYAFC